MKAKYLLSFICFLVFPVAIKSEIFPATEDGQSWGYIDNSGEFVIEPQFRHVVRFNEGYARVVLQDESHGVIDENGELIYQSKNGSELWILGCQLISIRSRYGDTSVLDLNNQRIIGEYYVVGQCRNGFFPFQDFETELWGYSDRNGEIVKSPRYVFAGSFVEGRALVYKGEPDYWINEVIPVGDGYTFIDLHGDSFDAPGKAAGYFSDGKAHFWMNGGHGYINLDGEIVIKPNSKFTIPMGFSEGIGVSIDPSNRLIIYYDKQGSELFRKQGNTALSFVGQYGAFFDGKTWKIIAKDGEEVFSLKGGALRILEEGLILHLPNLSYNNLGDPLITDSYAYWKEGEIIQSFNYKGYAKD